MTKRPEVVPLADAAQELRLSWQQAWRRVLVGELLGEKRAGRWVVQVASVEAAKRRAGPTKQA